MDDKVNDTAPLEDAQILEDRTSQFEKLAEQVKDKDPAMADDLKKLAKSKLSMKAFDDYMKLKREMSKPRENEVNHVANVLAKRRKANKAAKKARKINRRK